jgi:hypothetical protein
MIARKLKQLKHTEGLKQFAMLAWLAAGLMTGVWIASSDSPVWGTINLIMCTFALAVGTLEIYTLRTRRDSQFEAEVQVTVQEVDLRDPVSPPSRAEWLIALLVPKRRVDSVLGDLAERFQRHVAIYGLRRARNLYWAEALRSVLPIAWAKAKKLGMIAAVAELWRRTHS